MKSWPVQDAKTRFNELLDACLAEGPQMVTQGDAETAVLVAVEEWRRLQPIAGLSLKQLLLRNEAGFGLTLPSRGKARRRKVSAST